MSLLPELLDADGFRRALIAGRAPGATVWTAAAAAIAARHQLAAAGSPAASFTPAASGSSVVLLSPRHCVKLHAPDDTMRAACATEVAALRRVEGALPVATPAVIAAGELDGWPYFVATRVGGVAIDEVWPALDPRARRRLAHAVGVAVAALHAVRVDDLAIGPAWAELAAAQRRGCVARERAGGLDDARVAELEALLVEGDRAPARRFRPALLHTELGPGHVLVEPGADGAIAGPSGLIDFGEAMIGDPEYDLAAVGLFVTRGDRAAFRAFGEGYGASAAELDDPARPLRLLRHALLHRYGTLTWYLQRLEPPDVSLEDLGDFWFGT
ncbi:MAG: phosphotransferase [Kofleriaceae bacterium]|nr:phosphotransferase [Kofleriaceae bacterium]MCB9574438.1 phosphotransferase [Kofleriaceae bacterium]